MIKNAKHIHFVGIGGIGVSALARMMLHQGKRVSGSDLSSTRITRELERLGAEVYERHAAEHAGPNVDVVVYSPAVSSDNPELVAGLQHGAHTMSYPEALGHVSKGMKTIAVAGTHGKTTTTAMLSGVLRKSVDPTVIVGSLLSGSNSNFIAGKKEYFLVEACEYKRSFLNLQPHILVITNVDEDHLDYYKDFADIQGAFAEMVGKVPENGYIVCNQRDEKVAPVLNNAKAKIVDYAPFVEGDLELRVPGAHNRENAAAARAVGQILGVSAKESREALEMFSGTWRRFEYKGKSPQGAKVYDDYAHNPTEVRATLAAAREIFPKERIVVVFQPHLYSRTRQLLDDFSLAFTDADTVIVAPIYAAREQDDGRTTNATLADSIGKTHGDATAVDSFVDIHKKLESVQDGSIVFTIGAGDIYKVAEQLTTTQA